MADRARTTRMPLEVMIRLRPRQLPVDTQLRLPMSSSNRFPGKIAFIPGAASGIGRATAVAFAREGARVAVLDRTEDALRHTAGAIKDAGGEVLVIGCDVSVPAQVEAAVARTVETFGRWTSPSTTRASRTRRRRFTRSSSTSGTASSTSICAEHLSA